VNSDTIARVPLVATMLAETPCTDILGLVVYDLPGRDCAAKASNGELKTGELSKYESQYIDREYSWDINFVTSDANFLNSHCCCHQGRTECCRRSDRRADSIPNLDTNANLTSSSSASDYKAGVAYALKNPNLRHVYRCWSRRMARMGRQLAFVLLDSSIIIWYYPFYIFLYHTSLYVILDHGPFRAHRTLDNCIYKCPKCPAFKGQLLQSIYSRIPPFKTYPTLQPQNQPN